MTRPAEAPRARLLAIALLVLALCARANAEAGEPPRVRLIATGGTIANGQQTRLAPDQLLAALPRLQRIARVEPETFANVSSTQLTLEDWARLSQRITAVLGSDRGLAGVVVTSGTDTLEELAWFLYLTVPGDRPVVVVGAMRRPGAPDADGPGNLLDAIRVASAPAARGLGTVVVMHGQVLDARTVTKRHATSVGAFDTDERARLGEVRRGRVRLARRPAHEPPPGTFRLEAGATLPRVDLLVTAQGASGDLIDAALASGARGIVLAGAGAGSLTPGQAAAVRRVGHEVPVVLATRTGAGTVTHSDATDRLPAIAAGDLQPLKARILLILALARRAGRAEIERVFDPDAAGRR